MKRIEAIDAVSVLIAALVLGFPLLFPGESMHWLAQGGAVVLLGLVFRNLKGLFLRKEEGGAA